VNFSIYQQSRVGRLEKEQTTDTGGKMTEGDKSAYDTQQGQGVQQQKVVLIK
jgi:hypothetical protein